MQQIAEMGPEESLIVKNYNELGFVKTRATDQLKTAELLKTTLALLAKFYPEGGCSGVTSWLDPRMHMALASFRRSDPQQFGIFYDALQLSASLHALHLHEQIARESALLLGCKPEDLCVTGHMFRLDAPFDQRNVLDWHQDSSYYLQNADGNHGIVVLLPLIPVSSEVGSVQFLPGSHKLGQIKTESREKDQYISSQQFKVPDQVLKNFSITDLVAAPDEIVYMHMNMVHRSGKNESNQFRLTTGVRFHRMDSSDFVAGRLRWFPNEAHQRQVNAYNQ